MTLPPDAIGLYAVCYCGISCSYSLSIFEGEERDYCFTLTVFLASCEG